MEICEMTEFNVEKVTNGYVLTEWWDDGQRNIVILKDMSNVSEYIIKNYVEKD